MSNAKGTNLGVEKAKDNSVNNAELQAIEEFEAGEQLEEELRSEEIEERDHFAEIRKNEEIGRELVKAYKGYEPEQFPMPDNEKISTYECWIPSSNKKPDGSAYVDYLRIYDEDKPNGGTYELRLFGKVWRWSKNDFEKINKVIFRKTVGYTLLSGKTSKEYLFVPKTNQIFELY